MEPYDDSILRYFRYAHFPYHVAEIAKFFADVAHELSHRLPDGPEKSVALRKLLESKDAAVRASLELGPAGVDKND